MLGPDDGTVAAEEEERADDGVDAPLVGGGPGGAAEFEEGEKDRARDEEARGGHQEWRHRFDGDADAEVGAAPNEVDRGESEDESGAGGSGGHGFFNHGWTRMNTDEKCGGDTEEKP